MEQSEVIALIQQELPHLIAQDPLVRDFVLRTVSGYYAEKQDTDSKFDWILAKLERDREEQARKWEEQNIKWGEQNRKWDEALAEIRRQDKRFDSTMGALGSGRDLAWEASFCHALTGSLTETFSVQVLNLTLYDHEGEVFGRLDQVELDIIISHGTTISCESKSESKSSVDKAGMYSFGRKPDFYAKHEQWEITRKIVISPMVYSRALPVAEALGIEVYSYADRVEGL